MSGKDIYSMREPNVCDLAYRSLGAAERPVYRALLRQITAGEDNLTYEGASGTVLDNVYRAIRRDHPEFFWLGGSRTIRTVTTTAGSVTTKEFFIVPKISDSLETIRKKAAELEKNVRNIASHAKLRRKLFDRILFVHDYIVDHTRYDCGAGAKLGGDEIPDASTAYGCLVKHTAICSGYAAAFQLIMQELGIVCGRVSGTAKNGRHCWNILCLENEWYYMDVTWDDPIRADGKDGKSYEYFCVTTENLTRTHIPDQGEKVPECYGKKYNYHRYLGYYYWGLYSRQRAAEILCPQAERGEMTIRFSAETERERAVADLITNGGIWKLDFRGKKWSSLSYNSGSSGKVLCIKMKE